MIFPEGCASPTARLAALTEQAAWFRRMGNGWGEVATRKAIRRIELNEAALAISLGEQKVGT